MVEPPMAAVAAVCNQDTGGQGNGGCVPPSVEVGCVVADGGKDGSAGNVDLEKRVHFPESDRCVVTPAPLGNRIRSVTRLRAEVRTLETRHDLPTKERLRLLASLLEDTDSGKRAIVQNAMRRVQRASKGAKYPVFYELGPLLHLAFGDVQVEEMAMPDLLDKLILQLRITTLMRSADAARIVWCLFFQDKQYYIKCTDKAGALLTFSVTGQTLMTLKEYL